MNRVNVYFIYNIINAPYGGANSFNRALKNYFAEHPQLGVDIVSRPEEAHVLFLNAASKGPRSVRRFSIRKLKFVSSMKDEFVALDELRHLKKKSNGVVVHRLDGLTTAYGRSDGKIYDQLQIALNAEAACTIFQSRYCEGLFRAHLRESLRSTVIHNGANGTIFSWHDRAKPHGKVRVLSVSWSSNPVKGHADLVNLAKLQQVELTHIGRWPKDIHPGNVVVKEPLGHDDLAAEMANFDIFCHMASGDPAPNVVLEALSTGLPVIYKVSGGTPEMVGERRYGVPLMNTSVEAMQNAVEESLERYISLTQTIKAEREKFLIDFAAPAYASVLKEAALQYAR